MEWWSLFRKLRKVIFAFIAIASLAWAVILSYYLSREWKHFVLSQRVIILVLISVNGITSLLLIVVVFRIKMEFVRMAFLLSIHIGSAVPFTLFGFGLSCDIFHTKTTCKMVNIAFVASAWAITGLLLGYTIYLCIMSRVPRPAPLFIPNLLLSTSTPDSQKGIRPESPASEYSQESFPRPKTIPKRLFLVNGMTSSSDVSSRMSQESHLGYAYGAVGPSGHHSQVPSVRSRLSSSTIISMRSASSRATVRPQLPPMGQVSRQNSVEQTPQPYIEAHAPPRLLVTPFTEPLSRHGTPETAFSALSFSSAPGNLYAGQMAQFNRVRSPPGPSMTPMNPTRYIDYLTPYGNVPSSHAQPSHPEAFPVRTGSPYMYSYSTPPVSVVYAPAYRGPFVTYTGVPVGMPPRLNTPDAHSIHSLAPSLHFEAHAEPRAPPAVHVRTTSDPVWRPYTASPHLPALDAPLPNPHAEIRRSGSVPGGSFGPRGDRLGVPPSLRAGAPEWRQLVMRAASAETL
ncbi:hypothetical protein A0H81_04157 [Grifola frondosa]|uniref:MARVEL domain-containing protein n=1 Tax=Grifola frondosa TaxID=5627 RepID=A0A1C7MHQ3_GRIFR|nr:hypothetical protein A0H81_04157 [Grifola frondosa]